MRSQPTIIDDANKKNATIIDKKYLQQLENAYNANLPNVLFVIHKRS